jgi:hypothetical protein
MGNYISTNHPCINWIVAASYKVFESYDAFSLRFPVVFVNPSACFVIFYLVRKYANDTVAGITALAFATNWRTLTLDSMLGFAGAYTGYGDLPGLHVDLHSWRKEKMALGVPGKLFHHGHWLFDKRFAFDCAPGHCLAGVFYLC